MKLFINVKRNSYLLCCFVFFSILSSCVVEIPEEDDVAPTLRFNIYGGGLNETMENPPTDFWTADDGTQYLNLDSDIEYGFSVLVSDTGGVSSLSFSMPKNIVLDINEDADITNSVITQIIGLAGNESSPATGLTITGTMRIPEGQFFDFNISGFDYGGQSGPENASYMTVTAFSN